MTLDLSVVLCYTMDSGKGGFYKMPIKYKINVLEALKEKGYNTGKIRKDKIMGEAMLQKIREGEMVSWAVFEKLCQLLNVSLATSLSM